MVFRPLSKSYNLTNAVFTIGADEYTDAVSQVEFTPSTKTSDWKGIGGNSITSVETATWTCTVGYAQDLAPEGLTRFLHEHEGEVFPCTFVPIKDDGPTIAATLQMSAASIGGQATGGTVTGQVTLAVQGKPQFVDDPEA